MPQVQKKPQIDLLQKGNRPREKRVMESLQEDMDKQNKEERTNKYYIYEYINQDKTWQFKDNSKTRTSTYSYQIEDPINT